MSKIVNDVSPPDPKKLVSVEHRTSDRIVGVVTSVAASTPWFIFTASVFDRTSLASKFAEVVSGHNPTVANGIKFSLFAGGLLLITFLLSSVPRRVTLARSVERETSGGPARLWVEKTSEGPK